MPIGAFRKRATFQREFDTPDAMGGFDHSWGGDLTVWGEFAPQSGREAIAAGALQSSDPGVLTVRSSAATRAVTSKWRVLIDRVPYQIRAITNPDQTNRFLSMTVEQGVGI